MKKRLGSRVADRFHLVANASGALDEVLRSRKRRVEYVVIDEPEPAPTVAPAIPPLPPSRAKQRELEARARRVLADRPRATHGR
jgi:hypothetical protein